MTSCTLMFQGMDILVRKKSDQPGAEHFTSLVDTAVYTRWACVHVHTYIQ